MQVGAAVAFITAADAAVQPDGAGQQSAASAAPAGDVQLLDVAEEFAGDVDDAVAPAPPVTPSAARTDGATASAASAASAAASPRG